LFKLAVHVSTRVILFSVELLMNLWTDLRAGFYLLRFYAVSLGFDKKFWIASSNRHAMCKARIARALSFETPRFIESFLFSFLHTYLPRPIVVSPIDVGAEKIYIRLEIFRDIIPLSVVRTYVLLPRTCVRSLCRLTFINYCLRRGRMPSHKSNRALSLSPYQPMYTRAGKCYTFGSIYFSRCTLLYDTYQTVCNFVSIFQGNFRRST